jgi:serine/threonine protein kinase
MLARYEILAEVARSANTVVYKARDRQLNRIVALKAIDGDSADSFHLERRFGFLREARLMAALNHPNIVRAYTVEEHNGRPYMTLEWVEGTALSTLLIGMPWPEWGAARLTASLAQALQVVHQLGFVHRNVSPAHVLVTGGGQPVLAGFGCAVKIANQVSTGRLVGTPRYMAPERAAGKVVGCAADIHAVGAMLYEMLAGRAVFPGETPLDTLLLVQTTTPVPPRKLQPNVPTELEDICLKCLEKEPERRYPSAEALADDLRRFCTPTTR